MRYAARFAGDHDAILIPVLAWVPPDGDLAQRLEDDGVATFDSAWERLGQQLAATLLAQPPAQQPARPQKG